MLIDICIGSRILCGDCRYIVLLVGSSIPIVVKYKTTASPASGPGYST